MKVLITGAAGQIGSGLAKRIVDNHDLVLVDNLNNGYVENLKNERGDMIAPFFKVDVATSEFFEWCSDKEYDCIIHLAAVSSLPDCEINPIDCIHSNVSATANVLDFARKVNVPHVIFASTSAVYEKNTEEVFTEDLEINPRLYYSLSKKMCEELVQSYRENYGLKITVLRFFNVFGPDGDRTRPHPPLLNYLYREFSEGRSPVLSGDGEQVRDFICIDDVVSMVELCLDKQPDDVFNVCTGRCVSVNEIAKWVAEAMDVNIEIKYKDAQNLWDKYPELFAGGYPLDKDIVAKETVKYSKGSYKKAEEVLGWTPRTDIENLVKEVTLRIK